MGKASTASLIQILAHSVGATDVTSRDVNTRAANFNPASYLGSFQPVSTGIANEEINIEEDNLRPAPYYQVNSPFNILGSYPNFNQPPSWEPERYLTDDPNQGSLYHEAPLGEVDSYEESDQGDVFERMSVDSQAPSPTTGSTSNTKWAIADKDEMSTSMTSISSLVVQCLQSLIHIDSEDLSSFESEVPSVLWKDELGRLRVWAANIGAYQTGQLSLDYRLRDASHIKEQTIRVLRRLQRTTEDITDVLNHTLEDDDFSDIIRDDDDGEKHTEMQSIYHALQDAITNLFQLSTAIRRPAHHDLLVGTRRSDTVFYEYFDRLHVMDKYPQAEEHIEMRLGLAIAHRRAIMMYRERQRNKLGHGLNQIIQDQAGEQSTRPPDTVATDLVEVSPTANDDRHSQAGDSQTSYAETILNGEGMMLPSPPKESVDGAPFECPYCFSIITVATRREWARHVFSDLMPYVCIWSDCPIPYRLYESRREWFAHLQSQHSVPDSSHINMDCPLCRSPIPSGKQLERHVGRHLEELALFALPRPDENDNEIEETAVSFDDDSDTSNMPTEGEECPQCGRVMRDLKTHMLTHSASRPFKCPIVTCEYHTRGLPRLYDKNRHTLAHFNGDLICGFCPDSEENGPRRFKRADVFKRHLTSVHGVEQTPPNSRKTHLITTTGTSRTDKLAGDCSICKETFRSPQHFYEHFDNCVMQAVEQQNPPITEDQIRTAGTKYGEDAQEMRRSSKM